MTNPDDPAFNGLPGSGSPGLTKREYFAALAMQGFCSYETDERINGWMQKWAKTACDIADALIAELNKTK